jgi:chromosome segregation ATPase
LPEWAEAELRELRDQADELTHKIQSAAKAVRTEVERDLRELRDKQGKLEAKLSYGANLAGTRLRGMLSDDEIRAAFKILNPELLSLPVRAGGQTIAGGGVILSDKQQLVAHLRSLAMNSEHGDFEDQGVHLDVTCLEPPDLEVHADPEKLRVQLKDVEQKIGQAKGLLAAIEQRDALMARRDQIDKQRKELERKLERYADWQREMQMYAQHRADRDTLQRQIEENEREQTKQTDRLEEIARRIEEIDLRTKEVNQQETSSETAFGA